MLIPTLFTLSLALPQTALPAAAPVQEPAPSLTWKDLTKSGFPLQFYGFLRLDAYVNTARMNSIILPATVSPEDGTAIDDDDAGFALDPRLTRFGFDVKPGKFGDTTVGGKLEIDFANFPSGVPESRPAPRIRVAWIDMARDEYGLRVGQDWDVISPLFPAVNGELLMWNAGNTGDRRAQIQARFTPKESRFDLKAALGLTGAITNEDLDTVAGERDGFDSGLPHLQLRAGLKLDGPVEKKPLELGAWGAIGKTETDTSFGGEKRHDVNIVGLDFQLPVSAAFSARGELWMGENLGDFRGGIGQSINTTSGDEIASEGGWAEFLYAASDKLKFHVGGTLDNPDHEDVPDNRPERNATVYVGTVKEWGTGVRTGFDVISWQTDWANSDDGDALRFNLYFQFNF